MTTASSEQTRRAVTKKSKRISGRSDFPIFFSASCILQNGKVYLSLNNGILLSLIVVTMFRRLAEGLTVDHSYMKSEGNLITLSDFLDFLSLLL